MINPNQVEQAAKAMIQIVGGLATLATMFLASQQQQGQDNIVDLSQYTQK